MDEEVQSSTVSILLDSLQPLLAFQKVPDNAVARGPSLKVVNHLAVDGFQQPLRTYLLIVVVENRI
jgi:hypothetical protein